MYAEARAKYSDVISRSTLPAGVKLRRLFVLKLKLKEEIFFLGKETTVSELWACCGHL
jgi:hypothetical protein